MSKPKTLLVRCAKGLKLPLPRRYLINSIKNHVSDDETSEVVNCSLVRKRILAKDLLIQEAPAPQPKAKKANSKKSEG